MKSLFCGLSLLTILLSPLAQAKDKALADIDPFVVSTHPVAGSLMVDPAIEEIRIVFSKTMQTYDKLNKKTPAANLWSVVYVDKTKFPKIVGDFGFLADGKTFVIPVELEANKSYLIGFNSKTNQKFKDLEDNPALPFILSFSTAPIE